MDVTVYPAIKVQVYGDDPRRVPPVHAVLGVKFTSNRERWVIDLAGAQFGFPEIVVPYADYLGTRVREIVSQPQPFQRQSMEDQCQLSEENLVDMHRPKIRRFAEERACRDWFERLFEDEVVAAAPHEFLLLRERFFKEKLRGFLDDLDEGMGNRVLSLCRGELLGELVESADTESLEAWDMSHREREVDEYELSTYVLYEYVLDDTDWVTESVG